MFDPLISPQREVQRVGDFFEQQKAFRLAALISLRKREGLPSPVSVDGAPLETRMDDSGNTAYYDAAGKKVDHVLFAGAGRNGKPGGMAIGKRKGSSLAEADAAWGSPYSGFKILEVAEDGRKLADELADLNRDAASMAGAIEVSYGAASEQAPDLVLNGTSDEAVDAGLQEYLKRGNKS